MMEPLLAIFDVDGTLVRINNSINFDALLVQSFRELDIMPPAENERDMLWRAGKDHEMLLNRWGVDDARRFWNVFDRLDFVARSNAIREGSITIFNDSLPTLHGLKASGNVVLAVHTNTPYRLAKYQLAYFDLDIFDFVLALDHDGYDQSRAKPEPWGIIHIQNVLGKRYNVEFSTRTVFIGDSRIDMLAARNAGVPSVLVHRQNTDPGDLGQLDSVQSLIDITPAYLEGLVQRFSHTFIKPGTNMSK